MAKYQSKTLRNTPKYVVGNCTFRVDEDGVLHLLTKLKDGKLDKNTVYTLRNLPTLKPVGKSTDFDGNEGVGGGVALTDEVITPMSPNEFTVLAQDDFEKARDHARAFGVTARGAEQLVERFAAFVRSQEGDESTVVEKGTGEDSEEKNLVVEDEPVKAEDEKTKGSKESAA